MTDLTLQQLFGANATQTETTVNIIKADLSKLTPVIDNRAEQLFVALILQVWNEFEGLLVDERGETIVDETGEVISYDQRELYEKLNLWFWKRQFIKGVILDIFVTDVFIKPPPAFGSALISNKLVY